MQEVGLTEYIRLRPSPADRSRHYVDPPDPPAGSRRRAHCRCCMRHGRWLRYLEGASTHHRSSGSRMCELSSVPDL